MVNSKKLKILELTNYSAGGCGVWARAKQESQELSKKGYEVQIFSSNLEKGTNKIIPEIDKVEGIKIHRFPAKKLGGESFLFWFNKHAIQEAIEYSPDIIIVHSYRHLHTIKALKIRRILKKQGKSCKVFLVTHAPFAREKTRSFSEKLIVGMYDFFIGRNTLTKFDKVIMIANWEREFLINLGVKPDKIIYIPNGIPLEFFKIKINKEEKQKILFLGRISPIKNLEVLINALALIKNKKIKLEIVGPAEKDYLLGLKKLIENRDLNKQVTFSKPIYNIFEKIRKIDSARVFVLPSKSEGMPQSLIESMAREKLVIGSNILAIRELIENNVNGFLFESNSEEDLARKIDIALRKNNFKIKKQARKSVKVFSLNNTIKKIESLL